MFIVTDERTHVGTSPPADTALLWIESEVISHKSVTDVLSSDNRFELTNANISQLLDNQSGLVFSQPALTIYEIVETDSLNIIVKLFDNVSKAWIDATDEVARNVARVVKYLDDIIKIQNSLIQNEDIKEIEKSVNLLITTNHNSITDVGMTEYTDEIDNIITIQKFIDRR